MHPARTRPATVLVLVLMLATTLAGCLDTGEPESRTVASGRVESGEKLWRFGEDRYLPAEVEGGRNIRSGFDVDADETHAFRVHLSGTLDTEDAVVGLEITTPGGDEGDALMLRAEEGGTDDYGTVRTFFAFDRTIRLDAHGSDEETTGHWNLTLRGQGGIDTVKVEVRAFSGDDAVHDASFVLDEANMTTGRLRITLAADGMGDAPHAQLFGPTVEPVIELVLESAQDSDEVGVVVEDPGEYTLRIHHAAFAGDLTWRVDEMG